MSDVTRTHDADPAAPWPTRTTSDGPASPPPPAPAGCVAAPPGYEVLEELGRGGGGVVYRARHLALNRVVALKMLLGAELSDPCRLARFRVEAEAVAAVRHPNVVQVYEVGEHEGRPFMALEYLPGGTLSGRVGRGRRLPPRAAADLVARLAEAVQAAHDQGIIHRDLKPSNVLFAGPDGQAAEPKLTDFGLAKRHASDLTRTEAVMGTPAYMAPEQARGEAKFVGPAADVWALGVILYECLTGVRPFDAPDHWALLRRVLSDEPVPPRRHVPETPRDLELIVLKCLAKSPAERYPTAAALADDLGRFLDGRPVSVRPAGTAERLARWARRNPVVAGLLTALLVVAAAGFVGVTWGLVRAEGRGRELARANGDLRQSRDDLARAEAEARRRADEAEAQGYLSDVALAHQFWRANDLRGMREALDRCPPHRRKWEWRYLDAQSRPEKAVLPIDSLPLALAYSPDGKFLAVLTVRGTLLVFDTADGRERFRAEEPRPDGVAALAFRPDGGELAYTTHGGLWLVDPAGGRAKRLDGAEAGGLRAPFRYVALGYAGGRLLGAAVVFKDKGQPPTFLIRDVAADRTLATLNVPGAPPCFVGRVGGTAFSPDGARFAAVVLDSGVRMNAPGGPFQPFRPTVLVWDVASGTLLRQAECGPNILGAVTFAPDGRSVGYGRRGQAGEVRPGHVGDVRAELPRLTAGHAGDVLAVCFDGNGLIWSAGEDKLVLGHDRATGDRRFALRGCPNAVTRLAVSPDGKEVAAGIGDAAGGAEVRRFSLAGPAADVWRAPGGNRTSLVTALSADGERAAVGDFSPDGAGAVRFVVRDVQAGTERTVEPAGRWLRGVLGPGGGLAVLERDRVRLFGPDWAEAGALRPDEDWDPSVPPVLALTPDGKTLVTVGVGKRGEGAAKRLGTVRVTAWDLGARRAGPTTEADLNGALPPEAAEAAVLPLGGAASPDGRRVAAAFTLLWLAPDRASFRSRGAVLVWDTATGTELLRRFTDEQLHAVAFDPAGRVLAAGGSAGGGRLVGWDLATGEEAFSWRGHTRPILAVAVSPDGRVATGGADRVVKVWDAQTGREVLTLDGFPRAVSHLAFTRDGRALVTGTGFDWVSELAQAGAPTDRPPAEIRVFRAPP
jgi:eukaryotic-like serine/threonine-protein kinase